MPLVWRASRTAKRDVSLPCGGVHQKIDSVLPCVAETIMAPVYTRVLCQTCSVLAASLEDASDRLALTISQMRTISGIGMPEAFQATFRRAQSLRRECEILMTEVE